MRGKDPAKDVTNLQVIVAPSLTLEGADYNDSNLLVDNLEKRFIDMIKQIMDQKRHNSPTLLDVSERLGVPLEEGLEVMMKLLKRGFLNLSTSPMLISPAEQQIFSTLLSNSLREKQAIYPLSSLVEKMDGPGEYLARLLVNMHEKGMLICKNNRVL
jgi:hypothetical protein